MTGINIQDGAIYPASFLDKGPDEFVRHARIFGGVRGVSCSLSCRSLQYNASIVNMFLCSCDLALIR